jgi:6-pyruvoyltetrahydropterin/6-carboxytetrahydropterin synthase
MPRQREDPPNDVKDADRRASVLSTALARGSALLGAITRKDRRRPVSEGQSSTTATGIERLGRMWAGQTPAGPGATTIVSDAAQSDRGAASSLDQRPSILVATPPPTLVVSLDPTVTRDYLDPTAVLYARSSLSLGGTYHMAVDVFFNARHYVVSYGYRGAIHTHSFRVQVCCRSRILDASQRVVGFAEVKHLVEQTVAPFSNQLLNDLPVFADLQPTSECLVTMIAHLIEPKIGDLPVKLTFVTLWEAPSVSVTYSLDAATRHPEDRPPEAPIVAR